MDLQRLRILALALSLFFLFVLNPTDPMHGEMDNLTEESKRADADNFNEISRIYSVLRTHKKDLDHIAAWTIAKTILEESKKYSLDPMLVLAVIKVESSFQHLAVSPVGARGLMQIRPFVANAIAPEVDIKPWYGIDSLDDPVLNIKIGVFYLSRLKKRFRDMKLALTAYNWGPTKIGYRLKSRGQVPLEYARKVLSAYHFYSRDLPQNP
jgi:soluble lytic murein transglycosylase